MSDKPPERFPGWCNPYMKLNYKRITQLIAARRCFNGGQTIKAIAASANKSTDTIRRWLKQTER